MNACQIGQIISTIYSLSIIFAIIAFYGWRRGRSGMHMAWRIAAFVVMAVSALIVLDFSTLAIVSAFLPGPATPPPSCH